MNDLFELLANSPDRSSKIYGVAVAKVIDIRDPDGLGRVRLSFPWLANDDADTVVIEENDHRAHSYWARVATLMGGGGRGSYFIPDVDEEVLVAFEHGELDRPVVIGILWNKEDMPPIQMDEDGKNDVRGIYTRSAHKIVWNDSDDKASILIVDNTGNNRILIDTANKRMEIAVDGDMTISATGDIEITAQKNITISAQQDITIKANMNVKVDAQASAAVAGKTSATLQSDASTEVKGAMVAVKGSGMTDIQGGLVKIN